MNRHSCYNLQKLRQSIFCLASRGSGLGQNRTQQGIADLNKTASATLLFFFREAHLI